MWELYFNAIERSGLLITWWHLRMKFCISSKNIMVILVYVCMHNCVGMYVCT
uniref:Taraxerol synthase n=1 Tax=Rhizophora mucronata TaxID=61149 RepID=A0A2P2MRV2_RHIMU